jgi:hypothetical protein
MSGRGHITMLILSHTTLPEDICRLSIGGISFCLVDSKGNSYLKEVMVSIKMSLSKVEESGIIN